MTQTCSCCNVAKPIASYHAQYGIPVKQCKECTAIKRRVQRSKAKQGKFVSKERIRGFEEPTHELKDWRDAMLHFRGGCAFCGKPEGRAKADKMDRDHLLPLSKGGKASRSNIVPACRKCNRGRGNKLWRDWFAEQTFYDETRARRLEEWESGAV